MRPLALLSSFALTLALTAASGAATIVGSATLTGDQEVPPVATAASGTLSFTLDDTTLLMDLTGSVQGLSVADITFPSGPLAFGTFGPLHIHAGAAGTNGGIVVPFSEASFFTDTATGFDVSAMGIPVDASVIPQLLSGDTYFNLHTPPNDGGEIRGQISAAIPEPSSALLFGLAIGLAALHTRGRAM